MRKLLCNKIFWIVTALILIVTAGASTAVILLWNDSHIPEAKVTFYGFSATVNYSDYLNESNGDIILPESITNGDNFSMIYTDAESNLGIQTTLYGMKDDLNNKDNDDLFFIVGEGPYKENHTVVRIFNKYQAKTAQFLAYPYNVLGGVKVTGAQIAYDDSLRNIIITAAYNGKYNESRSVRIFDEFGLIYMEIIPDFADEAPYNVVTGDFCDNEGQELMISAVNANNNGEVSYAIYSLINGDLLLKSKFDFGKSASGSSTVFTIKHNDEKKDSVNAYVKGINKGYNCIVGNDSSVEALNIQLPYNATGIYSSSFDDKGYLVSLEGELNSSDSFVKIYENDQMFGNTINVAALENYCFWDCDNIEELKKTVSLNSIKSSEFIKRAEKINVEPGSNSNYDLTDTSFLSVSMGSIGLDNEQNSLNKVRTSFDELAELFKNDPEKIVALELFFKVDIDSDGEVTLNNEESRKNAERTLTKALREALIAGFPPEIISVAVEENKFNYSDCLFNCISSISRSSFGGWTINNSSTMSLALKSGFYGLNVNKYNSDFHSNVKAYEQLKNLLSSGVKYVYFTDNERYSAVNDLKALESIAEGDFVKLGYSGGTGASVPVNIQGKCYNVIQIGSGDSKNGLLKSIDSEGNFEGSVYFVPFRTHVEIEHFGLQTNPRTGTSQSHLTQLRPGDMIDVRFIGKYMGADNATLYIDVYEDGTLNEKLSTSFSLSNKIENYRFVISNQDFLGKINIRARFQCDEYNDVKIESLYGTVQRESSASIYYNDYAVNPHKGGVSFDVLSEKYIYGD